MAEVIHFGDDAYRNGEDRHPTTFSDADELRRIVSRFSVLAEVEDRRHYALVRVHEGVGTTEYFARGNSDLFWLQQRAKKVEKRGTTTVYHLEYTPYVQKK